MKIFFDTEFQEMPDTRLVPISFGFDREDGQELYVPMAGVFEDDMSDWVLVNVGRHLQWIDGNKMLMYRKRTDGYERKIARKAIKDFCDDSPEFWADWAAYDWVTLCQLFGTMMDLPKGWPMFVRDFQQLLDDVVIHIDGNHDDRTSGRHHLEAVGPQQDPATLHHALHDARHLKAQYDFIHSGL